METAQFSALYEELKAIDPEIADTIQIKNVASDPGTSFPSFFIWNVTADEVKALVQILSDMRAGKDILSLSMQLSS